MRRNPVAHGARRPGRERPLRQVVAHEIGEHRDEARRVVQGTAAQEVHAGRDGDLAQLDVEVVERLHVICDEAEGHDEELLPACLGELAHGGTSLGLEPLSAAPALALKGQTPGPGHEGGYQTGRGLAKLVDVGIAPVTVSSGTLCAVNSSANSLGSAPSSASLTRWLSAAR